MDQRLPESNQKRIPDGATGPAIVADPDGAGQLRRLPVQVHRQRRETGAAGRLRRHCGTAGASPRPGHHPQRNEAHPRAAVQLPRRLHIHHLWQERGEPQEDGRSGQHHLRRQQRPGDRARRRHQIRLPSTGRVRAERTGSPPQTPGASLPQRRLGRAQRITPHLPLQVTTTFHQ